MKVCLVSCLWKGHVAGQNCGSWEFCRVWAMAISSPCNFDPEILLLLRSISVDLTNLLKTHVFQSYHFQEVWHNILLPSVLNCGCTHGKGILSAPPLFCPALLTSNIPRDQQVTSSLETKAFCFLSFCIKLSKLMIYITNWRVKGPPFGTRSSIHMMIFVNSGDTNTASNLMDPF